MIWVFLVRGKKLDPTLALAVKACSTVGQLSKTLTIEQCLALRSIVGIYAYEREEYEWRFMCSPPPLGEHVYHLLERFEIIMTRADGGGKRGRRRVRWIIEWSEAEGGMLLERMLGSGGFEGRGRRGMRYAVCFRAFLVFL